MTSNREARDARQARLDDAFRPSIEAAFEANLGSAAKARVAVEDLNAFIDAVCEDIDEHGLSLVNREHLATYLLTHVGGDETQPWQDGHNYAMREAARLVREGWDLRAAQQQDEEGQPRAVLAGGVAADAPTSSDGGAK